MSLNNYPSRITLNHQEQIRQQLQGGLDWFLKNRDQSASGDRPILKLEARYVLCTISISLYAINHRVHTAGLERYCGETCPKIFLLVKNPGEYKTLLTLCLVTQSTYGLLIQSELVLILIQNVLLQSTHACMHCYFGV